MNKIKYFRQKRGLTIKELSEKANVSIGYISDLENNKDKNPTMRTLERLADALDVSLINLFPDKVNKEGE